MVKFMLEKLLLFKIIQVISVFNPSWFYNLHVIIKSFVVDKLFPTIKDNIIPIFNPRLFHSLHLIIQTLSWIKCCLS